jgi:hypothetical protein
MNKEELRLIHEEIAWAYRNKAHATTFHTNLTILTMVDELERIFKDSGMEIEETVGVRILELYDMMTMTEEMPYLLDWLQWKDRMVCKFRQA